MKRCFVLVSALILALGILTTGLPTHPVLAADPLELLELKISLWPEYDQPGMLVIYRGQVDQSEPGPADIQLQIPASALDTLQVAYSETGQLFTVDYTKTVTGPLVTLDFNTPNGSFQLEYYDSNLKLDSTTRHYTFAATNPYLAQNLILEVQQPAGAGNLTTDPALGNPIPGPDGLTYETQIQNNVPAGTPIKVNLSYDKTTSLLTVNNPNPDATPTPAATSQGAPSWIWGVLGLVIVGAVVGGLIWVGRPKARNKARSKKQGSAGAKPAPAKAVFCQQCGQKAKAGDQFCRKCGATLRVSQ